MRLARGESVFVPHGTGAVVVDGEGDVVVAYVP
jgi:mannose-6-phosphate isomerase